MRPAIANPGMAVKYYTFDAQSFEPSCSYQAAVDDVRLRSRSPTQMNDSRGAGTNDQDVRLNLLDAVQVPARSQKQRLIFRVLNQLFDPR